MGDETGIRIRAPRSESQSAALHRIHAMTADDTDPDPDDDDTSWDKTREEHDAEFLRLNFDTPNWDNETRDERIRRQVDRLRARDKLAEIAARARKEP